MEYTLGRSIRVRFHFDITSILSSKMYIAHLPLKLLRSIYYTYALSLLYTLFTNPQWLRTSYRIYLLMLPPVKCTIQPPLEAFQVQLLRWPVEGDSTGDGYYHINQHETIKNMEKIHLKANIVFQTSSFWGSILGFRSCKWWEIEGWFNHLYVYEEFKLTFIQSCGEIWQLDFQGDPNSRVLNIQNLEDRWKPPEVFFAKNHGEGKLEPVSLSNCCSGEKKRIHLHKSLKKKQVTEVKKPPFQWG